MKSIFDIFGGAGTREKSHGPEIDRATIEKQIEEARTAFDKIRSFSYAEQMLQAMVTSTFLGFAAVSQLLKLGPREQLQAINLGLDTVKKVLVQRGAGELTRYGKRALLTEVTREMAQLAVDQARHAVGQTDIMLHKGASRHGLLSQRLLEFSVASCLLAPHGDAQAHMMSMANELVAEILKAEGPYGRNVVKIQ